MVPFLFLHSDLDSRVRGNDPQINKTASPVTLRNWPCDYQQPTTNCQPLTTNYYFAYSVARVSRMTVTLI